MNSLLRSMKKINGEDNLKADNSSVHEKETEEKKSITKPILIINKNENPDTEKQYKKIINKTMINEKVPIAKTFRNKLGNTVFICNSIENRNKLRDEIVKNIPDVSYKAPPPHRQVVAVVGFDNDCTIENLYDALVNQNQFIKDFLAFNESTVSDHLSHLSTKPLKNNSELSQAIFKVSPTLRQLMKRFFDKVIIGSTRCRIFDRHNLKRCNNCYDFGHFAAECKAENPVCGYCSGRHQTSDCPVKSTDNSVPVCCNCTKSDEHSQSTNHPAYSFDCPVYKSHLNMR